MDSASSEDAADNKINVVEESSVWTSFPLFYALCHSWPFHFSLWLNTSYCH